LAHDIACNHRRLTDDPEFGLLEVAANQVHVVGYVHIGAVHPKSRVISPRSIGIIGIYGVQVEPGRRVGAL
jgi:hypothetical protein